MRDSLCHPRSSSARLPFRTHSHDTRICASTPARPTQSTERDTHVPSDDTTCAEEKVSMQEMRRALLQAASAVQRAQECIALGSMCCNSNESKSSSSSTTARVLTCVRSNTLGRKQQDGINDKENEESTRVEGTFADVTVSSMTESKKCDYDNSDRGNMIAHTNDHSQHGHTDEEEEQGCHGRAVDCTERDAPCRIRDSSVHTSSNRPAESLALAQEKQVQLVALCQLRAALQSVTQCAEMVAAKSALCRNVTQRDTMLRRTRAAMERYLAVQSQQTAAQYGTWTHAMTHCTYQRDGLAERAAGTLAQACARQRMHSAFARWQLTRTHGSGTIGTKSNHDMNATHRNTAVVVVGPGTGNKTKENSKDRDSRDDTDGDYGHKAAQGGPGDDKISYKAGEATAVHDSSPMTGNACRVMRGDRHWSAESAPEASCTPLSSSSSSCHAAPTCRHREALRQLTDEFGARTASYVRARQAAAHAAEQTEQKLSGVISQLTASLRQAEAHTDCAAARQQRWLCEQHILWTHLSEAHWRIFTDALRSHCLHPLSRQCQRLRQRVRLLAPLSDRVVRGDALVRRLEGACLQAQHTQHRLRAHTARLEQQRTRCLGWGASLQQRVQQGHVWHVWRVRSMCHVMQNSMNRLQQQQQIHMAKEQQMQQMQKEQHEMYKEQQMQKEQVMQMQIHKEQQMQQRCAALAHKAACDRRFVEQVAELCADEAESRLAWVMRGSRGWLQLCRTLMQGWQQESRWQSAALGLHAQGCAGWGVYHDAMMRRQRLALAHCLRRAVQQRQWMGYWTRWVVWRRSRGAAVAVSLWGRAGACVTERQDAGAVAGRSARRIQQQQQQQQHEPPRHEKQVEEQHTMQRQHCQQPMQHADQPRQRGEEQMRHVDQQQHAKQTQQMVWNRWSAMVNARRVSCGRCTRAEQRRSLASNAAAAAAAVAVAPVHDGAHAAPHSPRRARTMTAQRRKSYRSLARATRTARRRIRAAEGMTHPLLAPSLPRWSRSALPAHSRRWVCSKQAARGTGNGMRRQDSPLSRAWLTECVARKATGAAVAAAVGYDAGRPRQTDKRCGDYRVLCERVEHWARWNCWWGEGVEPTLWQSVMHLNACKVDCVFEAMRVRCEALTKRVWAEVCGREECETEMIRWRERVAAAPVMRVLYASTCTQTDLLGRACEAKDTQTDLLGRACEAKDTQTDLQQRACEEKCTQSSAVCRVLCSTGSQTEVVASARRPQCTQTDPWTERRIHALAQKPSRVQHTQTDALRCGKSSLARWTQTDLLEVPHTRVQGTQTAHTEPIRTALESNAHPTLSGRVARASLCGAAQEHSSDELARRSESSMRVSHGMTGSETSEGQDGGSVYAEREACAARQETNDPVCLRSGQDGVHVCAVSFASADGGVNTTSRARKKEGTADVVDQHRHSNTTISSGSCSNKPSELSSVHRSSPIRLMSRRSQQSDVRIGQHGSSSRSVSSLTLPTSSMPCAESNWIRPTARHRDTAPAQIPSERWRAPDADVMLVKKGIRHVLQEESSHSDNNHIDSSTGADKDASVESTMKNSRRDLRKATPTQSIQAADVVSARQKSSHCRQWYECASPPDASPSPSTASSSSAVSLHPPTQQHSRVTRSPHRCRQAVTSPQPAYIATPSLLSSTKQQHQKQQKQQDRSKTKKLHKPRKASSVPPGARPTAMDSAPLVLARQVLHYSRELSEQSALQESQRRSAEQLATRLDALIDAGVSIERGIAELGG